MIKKRNVDAKQIAFQAMIDNGIKIKTNVADDNKRVRIIVRGDKVSIVPVIRSKETIIAQKKIIKAISESYRVRGIRNMRGIQSFRLSNEGKSKLEDNKVHIYKKDFIKSGD